MVKIRANINKASEAFALGAEQSEDKSGERSKKMVVAFNEEENSRVDLLSKKFGLSKRGIVRLAVAKLYESEV